MYYVTYIETKIEVGKWQGPDPIDRERNERKSEHKG